MGTSGGVAPIPALPAAPARNGEVRILSGSSTSPVAWQNRSFARRSRLFDHLVGAGEDRWWHGKAQRLVSLKIDYQLDSRRLLDWQIGGPAAFDDLSGIYANVAVGGREARSITDQPAGSNELAPLIDR